MENKVVPRNEIQVETFDHQDIRRFLIDRSEPFGTPLTQRTRQPTPTDRPPPATKNDQVPNLGIHRYFRQEQSQPRNGCSEQEELN